MKKRSLTQTILLVIAAISVLAIAAISVVGCNGNNEEPITNTAESTIIKNATSVDEYLKKDDYKSIAYAYIYNIKSGLKSYESETNGTVKARVLFFDYDIKFNSVIYKNGNVFYSKDDSTSIFMDVQNEFYMVDQEKILVSRDLKKYDVYTLDDYHQISYSPNQYTVMGYVFNDGSISDANLVSNANDTVKIKYTLDNELATDLVKIDFKSNGGLTSYPEFKNIEMTLEMKKDFTPISYSIKSVYNASKPIIGTAEVTQEAKCVFSKINENITIPNESFLIQKLGADPSKINTDDDEAIIKNELSSALKNLDFKNGVNVRGDLALNLLGEQIKLNIDTNLAFDLARLSEDKIYNVLSFYGKFEGEESFNTIISLARIFAEDQLGEYAVLLDDFKKLEIIYDGDGGLFLIPTNQNDVSAAVLKIKLTDIVDLVLKHINVYDLVTGANTDLLTFKKIEGEDDNNYKVEINLNQETINSIKNGVDQLFENEKYSLLKSILNYKEFVSIKISVEVLDGILKNVDASFNYIEDDQTGSVVTLLELHLEASNQPFDGITEIETAEQLYNSYTSILGLKAKLDELLNNVYVSNLYLSNLVKAYDEYNELDDERKSFFIDNYEQNIQETIDRVNGVMSFLETYRKYDLDNLTNEDIYCLAKAYQLNQVNYTLLIGEIGEENYLKISSLGSIVDYSVFDSALNKIEGSVENNWGLTETEIREIKLIFDISEYDSSVSTQIFIRLLMNGKAISVDELKTKINVLYNILLQA